MSCRVFSFLISDLTRRAHSHGDNSENDDSPAARDQVGSYGAITCIYRYALTHLHYSGREAAFGNQLTLRQYKGLYIHIHIHRLSEADDRGLPPVRKRRKARRRHPARRHDLFPSLGLRPDEAAHERLELEEAAPHG